MTLEVVGSHVTPAPKTPVDAAPVANGDDPPRSARDPAAGRAHDDEEIVCQLVGAARDSFSLGPGRALLNAASNRRLQAALHDPC